MFEAWTAYVGTASLLVAAGAYVGIGHLLGHQRVEPTLVRAHKAFRTWWYAFGAALATMAVLLAATMAGVVDLPTQLALVEFFILANCLAAAGLVAHFLFVATGNRLVIPLMAPALVLFAFGYTRLLFSLDITSMQYVGGDLVVAWNAPESSSAAILLLAGFFAPHVWAGLGYAALMFAAPTRAARGRVGLIAATVLVAAFSPGFIMLADAMGRADLRLLFHAMGLVAPLFALWAYAPPGWLQRKLGLEPVVAVGFSTGRLARRRRP